MRRATLALSLALVLSAPLMAQDTPPPAADALPEDARGLEDGIYARLETTKGVMIARLEHARAPETVANFVGLIEGTKPWTDPKTRQRVTRPFYDGLTFHRVIQGFMIQGGCPQGNGLGSPGYNLPAEFAEHPVKDQLKHVPGRVSMARAGHNDSAGCQFFICVGEPSHLDGQYTVFGEVTRGLDVVRAIAGAETASDAERSRPRETIRIVSVRLAPAPTRS